uniref:Methyltransferase domain-containing protein n=1 Tax=Oryza barthii TaxID=65489 RepID=A0A0D3G1Q1_9ORYZ
MLPSHLNGHSPLARRRPRLSAASPPATGDSDAAAAAADAPLAEHDRIYFQSYSHIGIHEAMIKDRVRTDAYRSAIMHHQKFIEGKVVMDVGCGTGILSVFCARAGAKRVYAVEASEMATQAREIVKANNLDDKVVVVHGRVEDVEVEDKVDVIISEWMGYMLLYESMLPSVLFARDKWLKPGGLILPSHATLFMAPITNSERYEGSVDFWSDVYGINMSALVPLAKKFTSEEPSIEIIGGENVLSWPFVVKHIDCYTFKAEELKSITTKYKVSSMMLAPIHGFGLWFEVEFNGPSNPTDKSPSDLNPLDVIRKKRRRGSEDPVVLSTAPEDEPTHWHQTILYFPDPIEVKQDQIIEGSVKVSQSEENPRFLNIQLDCTLLIWIPRLLMVRSYNLQEGLFQQSRTEQMAASVVSTSAQATSPQQDRVRTDAYRSAIMHHQKFIEGKVVMDVGCGTGILSVFCARAGAKRVYAVEASEMATQAREIVKANNLDDKVVVVHGRVEDVEVEDKVDVIISEWMGYMLLYESMLPSVLFARDKWLKPGGLILPSHATLFMAPITNSERYEGSVDFWSDVYGINMSALVPLAKKFTSEEPSIEIIGGENVLSWPFVVKHIDCYTFKAEELKSITTKYKVSSMMLAPIHGFGLWFEVEFNGPSNPTDKSPSDLNPLDVIRKKRRRGSEDPVVLSTAPEDEPTHWHQTILYFPDPIEVKQDQIIEGSVKVSQSEENPRFLNIQLDCTM